MLTQSSPVTENAITENYERPQLRSHNLRHDALLVLISLIWGSTFLIVKNAVALSGPFTYLALSYGIGSLLLALIFHKRLILISRTEILSGLVSANCSSWAQQIVNGTRAALINALEPMWAALFGMLLAGDRLSLLAWIGCGLILMGMIVGSVGKILISLPKSTQEAPCESNQGIL